MGIMARWYAGQIGANIRDDGTISVRGQEIGTWKNVEGSDHIEIDADPAVIEGLHDAAHNLEEVDWTSLGIDVTGLEDG